MPARAWELPTVEVGDTTFLLFGDGIASAESIVYVQRLNTGDYLVKFDTNEAIQFEPPMFGHEEADSLEDE